MPKEWMISGLDEHDLVAAINALADYPSDEYPSFDVSHIEDAKTWAKNNKFTVTPIPNVAEGLSERAKYFPEMYDRKFYLPICEKSSGYTQYDYLIGDSEQEAIDKVIEHFDDAAFEVTWEELQEHGWRIEILCFAPRTDIPIDEMGILYLRRIIAEDLERNKADLNNPDMEPRNRIKWCEQFLEWFNSDRTDGVVLTHEEMSPELRDEEIGNIVLKLLRLSMYFDSKIVLYHSDYEDDSANGRKYQFKMSFTGEEKRRPIRVEGNYASYVLKELLERAAQLKAEGK